MARYVKKYPDSLQFQCEQCKLVFTYFRESRSGMTYILSPDEVLCKCSELRAIVQVS